MVGDAIDIQVKLCLESYIFVNYIAMPWYTENITSYNEKHVGKC